MSRWKDQFQRCQDGCELEKLPVGFYFKIVGLRVWKQRTNPKDTNKEQNEKEEKLIDWGVTNTVLEIYPSFSKMNSIY